MSTTYLTIEPMRLEEFKKALDGDVQGAQDIAELCCTDGKIRVEFTRYGGSKVSDILTTIPCWSDHDDKFNELCYEEEDDDEAE